MTIDDLYEARRLYNDENMDFEEIAKLKGFKLFELYDLLKPDWERKQLDKFWQSRDNIYGMNIEDMMKEGYTTREMSFLISVRFGLIREYIKEKGYDWI